jgi:hypothetical protein
MTITETVLLTIVKVSYLVIEVLIILVPIRALITGPNKFLQDFRKDIIQDLNAEDALEIGMKGVVLQIKLNLM